MYLFPYVIGFALQGLINLFNNYFVALVIVAVVLKVITMLITNAGNKLSSKYKKLLPQIEKIKNTAGDVHQVEAGLTKLYEENGVKEINFFAGPVTTFIVVILITGFIKALFSPLKYMYRFPKEILASLAEACGTGSQMSMLAMFNSDSTIFANVLNEQYYNKLSTLSNSMIVGGWDLSVVPSAKYLIWLPVIALTIRALQIIMSSVFSYVINKGTDRNIKKTVKSFIPNIISLAIFSTLVFNVPAGLSVYYIISSLLDMIVSVYNFVKTMNKTEKAEVDAETVETVEEGENAEAVEAMPSDKSEDIIVEAKETEKTKEAVDSIEQI